MKSKDLRERSKEDLVELEKSLAKDVFQNRLKNFTNRLDDTSSMKKARRDLARVKTILLQQAKGSAPVAAKAEKPAKVAKAPKAKAAKLAPAAAPSKPAAEKSKPAKKTSKKSEAK